MTETIQQPRMHAAEAETVQEEQPAAWETAVLLALAFLVSLWYWFGHTRLSASAAYRGLGIGLTLSHWILSGAVLLLAKKRGTLRFTLSGAFLLLLSLLLSAAYGIYANIVMKLLNLPVLLCLSAQALFALTGRNECFPLSAQGLWEGFRRCFRSLFASWALPFRALVRRLCGRAEGAGGAGRILFGLFAASGAAALALLLLSGADEVFAGMMNSGIEKLNRIDGLFAARLILSLPLAMLLFSHLVSMLMPPVELRAVSPGAKNPTAVRMVLFALAAVYGLFAYIQIRYLFAGAESVRMSGGYAAYARSGFFQLVLVALLTLCLILPSLIFCREDRPVRVLSAVVAVLTAVIDFSAFFRMRLYIGAYGLTTLRIVTLWGIGVILLALLAALAKSFRPSLRICPLLAAAALTTWIGLNYMNMDRTVAENQVARFNEAFSGKAWPSAPGGEPAFSDRIAALASDQGWSPDYYPAFEKIENPSAREQALKLLKTRSAPKNPGEAPYTFPRLYDWTLSDLKVPQEPFPPVP